MSFPQKQESIFLDSHFHGNDKSFTGIYRQKKERIKKFTRTTIKNGK